MRTKMGAVLAVIALAGSAARAGAGDRSDERLRALEEQLRKAQEEIQLLRREREQDDAAGHRGRRPPRAGVPAGPGRGYLAPPLGSDDPVALLLETLRKQGMIGEEDYQALKQAIAAKKRRDEEERKAEEKGRSAETRMASEDNERAGEKKGQIPVRATYKIGKGLTFQSRDGKFEASIKNRLQTRYTFTDQSDPAKDDTSSFAVRRMKTLIRGHILYPSLRYQFQASFAPKPALDDAFLQWRPRPYFGAQVGQYRVPFNRQNINSSGSLQLVDRAITDEFFAFGRDQGVTVIGSWFGPKSDQLQWDLGIFNGNGVNPASNENSDHLGVARILYMPLGAFKYYTESDLDDGRKPLLGLGAAGAFNSQADTSGKEKATILGDTRFGRFFGSGIKDLFDVAQATADAQFRYRGFSVLGDYFWAEADPNTLPSKRAVGYDFQAGYFIIPRRLEAAFRYAFVDRDRDAAHSGLREVGGALGYFFLGQSLKLQMDVRELHDEAAAADSRDTMQYRTALQVVF